MYAVVLKKFEEFYIPKTNVTCERYRFFTRAQELGETVDHVTALCKLAQICDFRDIKDSLIFGCGGSAHHQMFVGGRRSLSDESPRDLQSGRSGCRRMVYSRCQGSVNVATVHHEEDDDDEGEEGCVQVDALRQRPSRAVRGVMIKDCMRCGETHPSRKCPAWGKRCLKCNGFNHLKSMCRTKRVNGIRIGSDRGSYEQDAPSPKDS